MTIQEAIRERHSVRRYNADPISEADRLRLGEVIAACNAESGLNIQLICDEPECFDTLFAHYGKFVNARNYIAIVGPKTLDDLEELGGYYGERIVLEAQMMGLNTCWVAGTYGKSKCKAEVSGDEKLVCVITVGYAAEKGSAHKSKETDKLCNVPEASRPEWFEAGLEAAVLAPTAMNQQRFLVSLEGEVPVITAKIGPMTRIDLGIVKYNFEAASGRKCK